MIGTYAAALAVCGASLAIGQAAIALCGRRRWSWLAPAVGLALVCAVCWGDGAAARRRGRLGDRGPGPGRSPRSPTSGAGRGRGEACARAGRWRCSPCSAPRCRSPSKATSGSSAPASTRTCPSTCWRPPGSPKGHGSQLLHQGYPLGPHAVVVALQQGARDRPGPGLQRALGRGAVLAPLTALAAFRELRPLPRSGRRPGRRPRLRRRLLLRPGRLQGDDRGVLRARLRAGAARGDAARAGASCRCASSPRR